MDTKSIIAEAKAKFDHNSSKDYLKDKYNAKLLLAEQGGLWKLSSEFISMLASYPKDQVVLIDTYSNPIQVNRIQILESAVSKYESVMAEYIEEHNQLKKNR